MPTRDQFRGFEYHRVHTRTTFSCIKNVERKARKRELATLDENQRAVGMLKPTVYRRDKNEGTYGGEGRTPVPTACPEDRGG